jgi:hypothetical protein
MKLIFLLLILPFTLNLQNLRHKTKSGCGRDEIEGKLRLESSPPVCKHYCLSVPLDNRQLFSLVSENKSPKTLNYFKFSEPNGKREGDADILSFDTDIPNNVADDGKNFKLAKIEPVKLGKKQISFRFSREDGTRYIFSAIKSEENIKLFTQFNVYIILANLLESASEGLRDSSGLVSPRKAESIKNTTSRENILDKQTDDMIELKPYKIVNNINLDLIKFDPLLVSANTDKYSQELEKLNTSSKITTEDQRDAFIEQLKVFDSSLHGTPCATKVETSGNKGCILQ